jgi:dihydrofolate reductase
LTEDLRRFRMITTGHSVIMGRKTHQSIIARLGHPLPDRTSIVLSSTRRLDGEAGVLWAASLETAISMARDISAGLGRDEFFIAGGASVYRQAIALINKVYLTRVHREVAGDATMPPDWLSGFTLVHRAEGSDRSAGSSYSFLEYLRETT